MLHTLGAGKTIESFGASDEGFSFREGGSPRFVTRKPLLDSVETASLQGPGGEAIARLSLFGAQVYGISGNNLVGYTLSGGMSCTADGVIRPMATFASCNQDPQNILAETGGGDNVAIATACGVQVIARKKDCQGELIWVQHMAEGGGLGQAIQVRGFATDGNSAVWSLERPTSSDPLMLKRKVYNFAITNAYESESTLAVLQGEASELLQDAKKLYTILYDQGSDMHAIARYDANTPGGPEVLVDKIKGAKQLAVRGGSLYWVEAGLSSHRIWVQTGVSRKVIACSSSPIGGLTITQNAAVWHARSPSEKTLTAVFAKQLP